MDLKSAIHPGALDLMFGSAENAARKGQSQYSTPIEVAAAIAQELPRHRPVIIDLTCGPGQLLAGAANPSTEFLLGLDVDPRGKDEAKRGKNDATPRSLFIHADLTAIYASMRQINFRADCFALNPPWSLAWHALGSGTASRLEGLAASEVPAVAKTFKALTLTRPGATIDSTLATLMIALDRLSSAGEGFLIGYTSTLERLIFAHDAVGSLMVQHIWKKQALPPGPWGNAGLATVLYFSASHDAGPSADGRFPRFVPRVNAYNASLKTVEQWRALQERAQAMLPDARPSFHLSLRHGQICARLGLFDTALTKVNKELAKAAGRLNDLNGRNPMQVVMQRDERNFILGLLKDRSADGRRTKEAGDYPWTVDPALRDAVRTAVHQYNAIRAPLVPLPKIQRLGYLDESDDILCLKDLGEFRAGRRYPLATRSVRFTRTVKRPNLHGQEEELELSGQELAILIHLGAADTEDHARCFMDGGLRAPGVSVGGEDFKIHFTLQELVDHFEIPEVPDLAAIDPARSNAFLEQLHRLEQLTAAT